MKRLAIFVMSGAFIAFAGSGPAAAEDIHLNNCGGLDRIAVSLSYQEQQGIDTRARPSLIKEAISAPGKAVHLIATGPVLGSMDARDVAFKAACSAGDIRVTATVTRASGYAGAVLKFTTWRPVVRLNLSNAGKRVRLDLTWRMVSSSGDEIHQGDLPDGSTQTYPLTLYYATP